jgi:hypothetical protein
MISILVSTGFRNSSTACCSARSNSACNRLLSSTRPLLCESLPCTQPSACYLRSCRRCRRKRSRTESRFPCWPPVKTGNRDPDSPPRFMVSSSCLVNQTRNPISSKVNTPHTAVAWVYELRLLASLRSYYLPSKSGESLNTAPSKRSPPWSVVP